MEYLIIYEHNSSNLHKIALSLRSIRSNKCLKIKNIDWIFYTDIAARILHIVTYSEVHRISGGALNRQDGELW